MLIPHKGHTDTIQVYSVTVMTHVKALQAGHSSQGTSEPITPAAILDDRKSLSIAFLTISDQYATLIFLIFFSQYGCRRPFGMTENHIRLHFSPFQINTQFFYIFFSKWPQVAILEVRFLPKTIGFFPYVLSMDMPNMKLIGEFMTELENPQAFWAFVYKMTARGHFVFPIDAKNHRVLVIWDLNGYGEYNLIGVLVTTLCGGGGDGGGDGGGATKNIISPKFSNFGDIIIVVHVYTLKSVLSIFVGLCPIPYMILL